MLSLRLYMEFVVDHRKLRKILWPPSIFLESNLKNKEKRKAFTPILPIRGATTKMMQALHFPSMFDSFFEVF